MINLSQVLVNPELIRNARINLRPKRLLVAAIVVALVSIVVIPSLLSMMRGGVRPNDFAKYYLPTVLVIQAVVLLFGGGIACLQSISREKELNTFDYQRITRLSPLDLAIGKLLGATSMAYFVFACFIPAALLGLPSSTYSLADVVDSYALLLLGAMSFHALTLMMSMLLSRSLSTGAILIFLFIASFTGLPWLVLVTLRANTVPESTDIPFFGVKVPFTPFFIFIYASLTAWFMLALMRNIKKDPSAYELYTPLQALAFASYLTFIFAGCMGSSKWPFETALMTSTWINRTIFFGLGLVLLRNRERSRRRLRELGDAGVSWFESSWPIPYLFTGIFVAGFLPLFFTGPASPAMTRYLSAPLPPPVVIDYGLLLFRSAFVGVSLCRDIMFLQWMNVRPGRRPFIRGLLYLFVYYSVTSALFFSAGRNPGPAEAAFQSVFAPMRALLQTQASWTQATGTWILALIAQCVITWFFAFLHRQELLSLAARPKKSPAFPTTAAVAR